MGNIHKTIEYKGYDINIYYDDNAENPRDWDKLGTFYTAHRKYCPEEEFDKHFEFDEVCDGRPGAFREEFLKKFIVLSIYLYDHSGQTVSTSPFGCRWDSGWFGMVAVSVEKLKKEFGWKNLTQKRRENIERYLQEEVETYNDYLTGSVYGFEINLHWEDDIIDSCWGYYSDDGIKQIESECKAVIDEHIANEKVQRLKDIALKGLQLLLPFPELIPINYTSESEFVESILT